jgi:tetratricopeptide (TPR) repeat protein
MVNILDKKAIEKTAESEYESLLRALRRRKGFGLLFVESTPVGGLELIAKIKRDLPQKKIDVLSLNKPITNLIEKVENFPDQDNLNILFITGLEKSLVEYIRPGYGGKGDYYNLDTIPPILSHLNWQRENFRDQFRHLCFVFILPKYAIKYILLRAPDFFDWGSGKIQIETKRDLVKQAVLRLAWLYAGFQTYQKWTTQQRLERLSEIHTYLEENLNSEEKFNLYFEQALILHFNKDYEEEIASYDNALKIKPDYHEAWYNRAIALGNLDRLKEEIFSYDQALKIKPDKYDAWYNRGIALRNLGRYEEAIASYDQALKIKPDKYDAWYSRGNLLVNLGRYEEAIASYDNALKIKSDSHDAWYNRGIALRQLGRLEEAIISYDQALKIKPDYAKAYYNKACAYALQENIDLAIENLKQAMNLDSKYLEMAKNNTDFDKIRHDSRFINLLNIEH